MMHLLRQAFKGLSQKWAVLRGPGAGEDARPPGSHLVIGVIEDWGNFLDAVTRLTPGPFPVWDGVAFLPLAQCRTPDFVLVLNAAPAGRRIKISIPPERLWFACGEPPDWLHRPLHEGQCEHSIVLCNDESLLGAQNGRTYLIEPPFTASWSVLRSFDELVATTQVAKPKALSWVTSDATLSKGHRYRMEFLARLRRQVTFDLFGRGFLPVADKWDGLAPYRYSIAFENMAAPRYFTEKIMDCFVCHTLPLYFGAPDIARHFPPKAFHVIDPEDPHVCDIIRDIAASDLWQERLPYILEAKELVLRKYNCFARLAGHFAQAAQVPPSAARRRVIEPARLDWDRARRE